MMLRFNRFFSIPYFLSLVLFCAGFVSAKLEISSSGLTDTTHAQPRHQMTWIIVHDHPIETFGIAVPGPVFASVEDSLQAEQKQHQQLQEGANLNASSNDFLTTFILHSDSIELLEWIEVLPIEYLNEKGIRIQLKNIENIPNIKGYLMTELKTTQKYAVRELDVAKSGSFIVKDGILLDKSPRDAIKIHSAGSVNVLITSSRTLQVESLSIANAGAGTIQLNVPYIQLTNDLSVSTAGSGVSVVFAEQDINTKSITTRIAGSGPVYIQSQKLEVNSIESDIAGSSSIYYSSNDGTCRNTHTINIAGSGSVHAANIKSQKVTVHVAGSGEAIANAVDTISSIFLGSGDVSYVGQEPKHISTFGIGHKRIRFKAIDPFQIVQQLSAPAPQPAYVDLQAEVKEMKASSSSSSPSSTLRGNVYSRIEGLSGVHTPALLVVVIGLGLFVFYLLSSSSRRHSYRPLP